MDVMAFYNEKRRLTVGQLDLRLCPPEWESRLRAWIAQGIFVDQLELELIYVRANIIIF